MWEVVSYGERPYWDMNNQDVSNFNIIESMRCLVEKKKRNAGILDVCE